MNKAGRQRGLRLLAELQTDTRTESDSVTLPGYKGRL